MHDLKNAYEILGLEETATDEEVEQRYTVLLLKNRSRPAADSQEAGPSMEEITKAYNRIKNAAIEEEVRQKEPKSKAVGRISHIWEYYRWHIFGTIAVVLLVFFTGKSIIENRAEERRIEQSDLKVTFFTDFQIQDLSPFEVKLLEGMTDWQEVYTVNQYAPIDPKDEYAMAMLQKAVVSMAADKPDVYIMDKANFDKFGKQGAYVNLDEIPALANTPEEKRRSTESEEEEQLWYGIDVTDSDAIKALTLPDVDKIAVIRVDSKNIDNAVKALEWMGNN